MSAVIVFRDFEKSLPRKNFDCGHETINTWFREQAWQQQKKNNVRTHLGLHTFNSEIACFYTLVAHQIETSKLEDAKIFASRKYPVPCILIAQLAVDIKYQNLGIGPLALADALQRVIAVSQHIGYELVVVDAIDARAAKFYRKWGFEQLTADGNRMFITLKDLLHNQAPDPMS